MLTTDFLARFVGGQLEVQNQNEDYIYRGEIASIDFEDGSITVRFTWVAKGKGGFPPHGWINDDNLDYVVSAAIYSSTMNDHRLIIHCALTGEVAVFFPPDGSKLDPAKVEGLVLAPT